MQRVRVDGKRIILELIPFLLLAFLIFVDQWSKVYFRNLWEDTGNTVLIKNFFTLTYTVNTGAAWGFLGDASWGQLFFKILTSVALIVFVIFYFYAIKKNNKWLKYTLIFVNAGTIGNFIDRLLFNGVTDFLSFNFWGYDFPVFNFADAFLTVGVIMLMVYFLFVDNNALFKRKTVQSLESKDGGEVANQDLSDNAK